MTNQPGIADDLERIAEVAEKRGWGRYIALAAIGAFLTAFGGIYSQWDSIIDLLAKDKIALAERRGSDAKADELAMVIKELQKTIGALSVENTRLKIYCKMTPACRRNFPDSFWGGSNE